MQLLLTYTIKARYEELKDKLKSEAFGPRQLLACVNDQVLADLMEGINAYLCETFLNCYGGQWQCDAIRDGHADALGIRTKQGEYISFLGCGASPFLRRGPAPLLCVLRSLPPGLQRDAPFAGGKIQRAARSVAFGTATAAGGKAVSQLCLGAAFCCAHAHGLLCLCPVKDAVS